MRQSSLIALLAISTALGTTPASSQDDAGGDDPELGGARVRMSLRSVAFYTDNFYNQSAAETSAVGALINPELRILAQSRKLDFLGGIEAEYGAFDLPGSEDDYLDGAVSAKLGFQPTVRNQLRLAGGFKLGHDPFGVDRTEDATVRDVDLDKWQRTSGSVHYRYGTPGALLNAEVGVSGLSKEYTTNRSATEVLNYDAITGEYAVFYNYSPKTSAVVDFSRTDFDFERPFGAVDTRGGQLYVVRVGWRWLATAKTSGDVRVGYRRRLFDAGTPDIEGPSWEAGIDWAPVPRSTVRLATSHSEQESYRADARVILVETVSLNWKYNVSARLRSTVSAEHLQLDFDSSGREDEIQSGAVGAEYLASSFVWLIGNVGYNERDSTLATRDYDRLNAFLGFRLGR